MKRFLLYFTSNFILVSVAIFFIFSILNFETVTYWHTTISSAIIIIAQYFFMSRTEHRLYRGLILYFSMCLFILVLFLFEIPFEDFLSGVFFFPLIGNLIGIIPFIIIVVFNRIFEKLFFEITDASFSAKRINLHRKIKTVILIISISFLGYWGITKLYKSYTTNWSEIKTNLPYNLSYDDILFTDSLKGYISGKISEDNLKLSLKKNKAIVFETNNGGKQWKKKQLDYGQINQIKTFEKSLYVIKTIFTEDGYNNNYSELFYSTDGIDSLTSIFNSKNYGWIRKIFLQQNDKGIIDLNNSLYTFNVKNKKLEITPLNFNGFSSINLKFVTNDTLVFSKKTYKNDTCITCITHIKSNYIEYDTIPEETELIIDNNKNIWKIIKKGTKQLFFKRIGQKKYIQMASYDVTENGIIHDIFIYDDHISGTLYTHISIMGVSHNYIYFNKKELKWIQEEIPFPLYGDFASFGKNHRWGKNFNPNELQIRK